MSVFELWGRSCRVCGCDDAHACYDPIAGWGCHWVESDLCSVCARGVANILPIARQSVSPLAGRAAAWAYVQSRQRERRLHNRWKLVYLAVPVLVLLAWAVS